MAKGRAAAKGRKSEARQFAGNHPSKRPWCNSGNVAGIRNLPKLPKSASSEPYQAAASGGVLLAPDRLLPLDTELPLHPTHQHNYPPPTKAELATIEKSHLSQCERP
jgi:hypothetical protein